MEKVSDTITSVFHIAVKDKRPVVCSSGDGATVWSEIFGLGWRFGIAYNPHAWFAKVRLYLDHTHSQTEQDLASVTVTLKESADKDAKGLKERETTIVDFGHGEPALLGSWSPSDFALYPYVTLALTTKARLPQPVANPPPPTSLALRKSLESGEFVDTKFYVFSAKRPRSTAGKPRVVYGNSKSFGFALPKSTPTARQANASDRRPPAPRFLVNMTSDNNINGDSVLHEYEYEQDSDLDDEDDDVFDTTTLPSGRFRSGLSKLHTPTGSESTDGSICDDSTAENDFPTGPPAYSVSNCRMILVKGVAYRTWLSYIYFRYTGQVSFRPLKSASFRGSPKKSANRGSEPPSCSPKSMYRLAVTLGDEAMKELAHRAIKEGLSKDNIVEEAFSWFTAQYPIISQYEVEKVFEFRKLPEVSSALKLQLKAVSIGEKPWAYDVLIATMDKLNPSVTSI